MMSWTTQMLRNRNPQRHLWKKWTKQGDTAMWGLMLVSAFKEQKKKTVADLRGGSLYPTPHPFLCRLQQICFYAKIIEKNLLLKNSSKRVYFDISIFQFILTMFIGLQLCRMLLVQSTQFCSNSVFCDNVSQHMSKLMLIHVR